MTKFRIGACAALAAASPSLAQIILGTAVAGNSAPVQYQLTFPGALAPTTGSGVYGPGAGTPFSYLGLKGDFTATPVQPYNGVYSVNIFAYVPFSVGPLPVQVTQSIGGYFVGKMANGGGNGALPATNWLIKSGIESDTNGTWGDGEPTVIFNNVYSDSLTGNGIKEFSVNGTPQPRSYVLGQGLNYFLYLQFETFITINNPPAGLPPIAVTAEFGGVSSYTGLRTDFDWKVVPTPGTAVLFSGSLLMLARRRRR